MPSLLRIRKRTFLPFLSTLVLLLTIVTGVVLVQKQQELHTQAAGTTWYVSKKGNNADGKSWTTAWNELDKINWSAVQSGDTILIDGGGTACAYPTAVTASSNTPKSASGGSCGMVYNSKLTVGKSGQSGKPITIRLASDADRDGTAVFFGGRSIPLPNCGQSAYDYPIKGHGSNSVGANSWIVIDGTKWGGIKIYGGSGGIGMSSSSKDSIIKNVEIYDNGVADLRSGKWFPNQKGVYLSGTRITFERVIIHDNGQDNFQSGGGINDITIRQSWLYNGRENPTKQGVSYNSCTHTDGVQIYNGGVQTGFLYEDTIIGPGFTQGMIMGNPLLPQGQYAKINDVTLRNTLVLNAYSTNIFAFADDDNENWVLENVTSLMAADNPGAGDQNHNVYLKGSGHRLTNSIFVGGFWGVSGASYSGNCGDHGNGIKAMPKFVTDLPSIPIKASLDTWIRADFSQRPESPCAGKGSRVTSVAQLLGSQPPLPPPSPTPGPSPTPTLAPSPLPGLSWEAEDGLIIFPFTATGGYISQSVETDLTVGGRASYRFNLSNAGDYIIKAIVDAANLGSNSFFVNIDGEPVSPEMIWDIGLTNGFEERTVSWRGSGTPDANEFVPKVWSLSAGEHELIIRGRERDTLIDKIIIEKMTTSSCALTADINCDGVVNILDFQLLNNSFGTNDPNSDINSDGTVNILDFQILSNNLGKTSG